MSDINNFRMLRAPIIGSLLVGVVFFLKTFTDKLNINLPDQTQDFFTLSLSVFIEAFPFLVLGSLLAALVKTFVSHKTFNKVLPKQPSLRRASMSVLGFLLPVCECGNVPLSRALMVQGLKPAEAITFLLSAPVINPVTIWSTWAAFGYDGNIVISRIAATLLIANLIGFLISLRKNQDEFLTSGFIKTCKSESTSSNKKEKRIERVANLFIHEAFTMAKMLAFGSIIAGLVQTFVPRDILTNLGGDMVLSVLAMLALAFVVSICANVDAFFALSFANTFSAGSIVSFLVFGPMIDIKMLALLKTTFKTELLALVTLISALLSLLVGLVVNYAF